MDDESRDGQRYLTVRRGQPLIGIPFPEGDDWVVRYFTSEADATAATAQYRDMVQKSLSAECEQSDEEFHEMLDELDRIRHRNPPTPLPEPFP
jgi:hypothetical protein